ncbi:MAG: UvrD-helicase domain-containing protein, partial [Phycisphaerae bacterium]|nr:UvrD-helicase domain-containing protein [Phycisphaerae bacterium]
MTVDLLQDLNEPQREAVTHVDGPLLVLAGAGSGKTRVITHRVAWLIQQGASPHNVLAITFTNKAADEMRSRARALGAAGGATLCTFHALCARLLREFATEAAISTSYTIYDADDQIRLVKEAVAGLYTHGSRFSPRAIRAAISRAKDDLKTPAALAGEVGTDYMKTAAEVYREYEKLLAANNALDFDDLLLRVAFLLRDHDEIRRRLSDRYRYVLIDEYQDTNRAQYIIAHSIVGEQGNICATGDPDQSIYAWRGADINNIMEFEQDYPSALVIRLEENYRSTKAILAAASKLISRNTFRKEKALWTRREGGGDVHVLHCDNAHSEAGEVVSRIARLHALGRKYGDVAVFYRLNSLSRLLEEALLQAGIPYRVARGVEFYNRKEIKDALAYLRLMANPDDSLSCRRIINVPARGIGARTVKRLAAFTEARGRSLLDACGAAADAGLSAAAAKKVRAFAGLIDDLGGGLDRPVREIVEEVINRTGLEDMLREGGEETRQALANVGELINSAAEFDARNEGGTLGDYLRQVSLVSDV